ncbi:hypothetical protein QQP08_025019 [Theobroma cacao]|nr:hypothetical protein QQP08_025019 [Theobroma cacao]
MKNVIGFGCPKAGGNNPICLTAGISYHIIFSSQAKVLVFPILLISHHKIPMMLKTLILFQRKTFPREIVFPVCLFSSRVGIGSDKSRNKEHDILSILVKLWVRLSLSTLLPENLRLAAAFVGYLLCGLNHGIFVGD